MTSWVIIEKSTGKAIAETYVKAKADRVSRELYDVKPIAEYLASLSRKEKGE